MIQFDLPQTQSSIIKVFGIGGGGGNAVNFMHNQGIDGVDFVLCNTDVKALENSAIPLKVQIGPALTSGLGAGANPEIGQKATEESIAEITNILKDNTKMVFITAGMGGGTGTGGAPIVAKVAKDLGILTVGIVTTPFSHEGRKRKLQAEEGIAKMRGNVDTILVISNDKLRHQFGNLGFKEAFSKADNILATATRCITDVINSRGHVIVDFADVCTVMRDGGSAILGSAVASGENRAKDAAEKAINSPLLNDDDIAGAKWILLNINSSEGAHEHTLDEMDLIQNYIQEKAGDNCDVILGTGYDNSLGDQIGITIIATGFNHKETRTAFDGEKAKPEDVKVVQTLNIPSATNTQAPSASVPDAETKIEAATPQSSNAILPELMPTLVQEVVMEAVAIPMRPAMSMRPMQVEAPTVVTIMEPIQKIEETPAITFATTIHPDTPSTKVVFELDNTASLPEPVQMPLAENNVIAFEAVQKTEEETVTIDGITISRKLGSRYLTDEEIREKVNFELQKKAFDERASKLRGFNYNPTAAPYGSSDHIEEVPAYLRNNKSFKEHAPLANENLSNYTVNTQNGEINSKNKWLHNNTTTD
jgi:cell division protein FtsZ